MKLYVKGARLSFTQSLFEAQPGPNGGKAKFSCAVIVEPGTLGYAGEANPDSAAGKAAGLKFGPFLEAASKAILDVAGKKWGPKRDEMIGTMKAKNMLFLHDGSEKGEVPGYKGNKFFNASNQIRPVIRDKTGAQLEAKDGVIYAGCYADVVVDVWPQDNQFGKRVNASLLSVTFSHDGERLAGGATASADDYAEIPSDQQEKAQTSGQGAASLFS